MYQMMAMKIKTFGLLQNIYTFRSKLLKIPWPLILHRLLTYTQTSPESNNVENNGEPKHLASRALVPRVLFCSMTSCYKWLYLGHL